MLLSGFWCFREWHELRRVFVLACVAAELNLGLAICATAESVVVLAIRLAIESNRKVFESRPWPQDAFRNRDGGPGNRVVLVL